MTLWLPTESSGIGSGEDGRSGRGWYGGWAVQVRVLVREWVGGGGRTGSAGGVDGFLVFLVFLFGSECFLSCLYTLLQISTSPGEGRVGTNLEVIDQTSGDVRTRSSCHRVRVGRRAQSSGSSTGRMIQARLNELEHVLECFLLASSVRCFHPSTQVRFLRCPRGEWGKDDEPC